MKTNKFKISLFLLFIVLSPLASAVKISISAPSEVSSSFEAQVLVDQIENFDAADFIVDFDESVLSLEEASAGELAPEASITLNTGLRKVVINVPGVEGVSGSGSIAKLRFSIIKAGRSNISLSYITLSNNFAEKIPVESISPAEVKITSSSPLQSGGGSDEAEKDETQQNESKQNETEQVTISQISTQEEGPAKASLEKTEPEQKQTKKQFFTTTNLALIILALLILAGAIYWFKFRKPKYPQAYYPQPQTPTYPQTPNQEQNNF